MKKICFLFLVAALSFLMINPSYADSEGKTDFPWEKFSLNLGGFISSINSDMSLGSDRSGIGITVDVEDLLGLQSSTNVFRADTFYRFGSTNRHRFDLNYFDYRRNSEKVLEAEVTIGDETFTVGTTVNSYWNMQVIRAKYGYSFFQDDRIDIAATLGMYVMPIEIGVSASRIGAEATDITAPLPTLGIRTDFAITPKLFLKQSLDVLYLEIDQFRGTILDLTIACEYNIWEHVGLGLGYNAFDLQIEAEGEDYPEINLNGQIGFRYSGLFLYGKIMF